MLEMPSHCASTVPRLFQAIQHIYRYFSHKEYTEYDNYGSRFYENDSSFHLVCRCPRILHGGRGGIVDSPLEI
jgi:hypothetical protein